MTAKYYISSGERNNFYTLRTTWDEVINAAGDVVTRDYHMRNLSTDRDEAIAKAKELTGLTLATGIEVRPIGERQPIDWSVFQAGKYAGKSVLEVAEIDEPYLLWVAENLTKSQSYAGTVDLIRALFARELAEKSAMEAAARAERNAALETMRASRKELLRTILPDFHSMTNTRGSQGEVTNTAIDGYITWWPKPNAHSHSGYRFWLARVVLDEATIPSTIADRILDFAAKAAGRRGSKAYSAEYFRVLGLLEGISE